MSDPLSTQTPNPERGAVTLLAEAIVRGQRIAERPNFAPGMLKMWLGQVRAPLRKIYGPESEAVKLWPLVEGTLTLDGARALIHDRIGRASQLLHSLEATVVKALSPDQGQ